MQRILPFFIVLISVLCNCKKPVNTDNAQIDALIENISKIELVATDPKRELLLPLDTFELTYFFDGCDCQRWLIKQVHDDASKKVEDVDEQDFRSGIEFNFTKNGFYIEPAAEELSLDWRLEVNGTSVRFIGRLYNDERLPENGGFTVPNPPVGRVLRYYSYEVLKPYKMWGPHKITIANGDTIEEPSVVVVE